MKMAELLPLKMWSFKLIITKPTLPAAYEVCRGGIYIHVINFKEASGRFFLSFPGGV